MTIIEIKQHPADETSEYDLEIYPHPRHHSHFPIVSFTNGLCVSVMRLTTREAIELLHQLKQYLNQRYPHSDKV